MPNFPSLMPGMMPGSNPRLRRLEMQCDRTFQTVDAEAMAIVDLPLDQVKTNAKARLAAWRFAQETNGTTLPDGTKLLTDRDTQDALNRILNSLDRGLVTPPVTYKGVDGWGELSKAQLTAIAGVVATHVQTCWAAERDASDQVDAAASLDAVRSILATAGA